MTQNLIPVPARTVLDLCGWNAVQFQEIEKFDQDRSLLLFTPSYYECVENLDERVIFVTPETLHNLEHPEESIDTSLPHISVVTTHHSSINSSDGCIHISIADAVILTPKSFTMIDTEVYIIWKDHTLLPVIEPAKTLTRGVIFTCGQIQPEDDGILLLLYNYSEHPILLEPGVPLAVVSFTRRAEVAYSIETTV